MFSAGRYDRSSLRVLGCVGEPLNHEAWQWYNDVVGDKRCDVIDTWWQTGQLTGGPCHQVIGDGPGQAAECDRGDGFGWSGVDGAHAER